MDNKNKDMATLERRYSRLLKHNSRMKARHIERLTVWIAQGYVSVNEMKEALSDIKGEK